MTEQDKHKFAVTGNQFHVQARAPGTAAFTKELLDHAMRMIEHARKQKKKHGKA